MNRRTLVLLLLVALLLLVTTWLSQKGREPEPVPEQAGAPIATYFIRGLEGTVTGANGLPSHYIQSEALFHYADSALVELKQPQVTVFLPKGEQWKVEANQGQLEGEGNQITLEGAVSLVQLSASQPLNVETERLRLYPDSRYGESDARISVSAPGGRISGVGMKLYGDERRLLLLSEVRGRYDSTMR